MAGPKKGEGPAEAPPSPRTPPQPMAADIPIIQLSISAVKNLNELGAGHERAR